VSYPTPERTVRAYKAMVDYAATRQRQGRDLQPTRHELPTPMNIEGAGIMDEHEAERLLDRWGIPVVPGTLVTGPGRHELTPIRKLATHFGYPVVLKAIQRDLTHKSEQGAIALGLASNEQLRDAWEAMHTRFPDAAWLIQPFLPGDVEVVIRGWRNPTCGPVVSFASGGVLTELYHDIAHRVAPLTEDDALEMIQETKAQALLGGFHGLPVHDPRELAEVIVRIGDLMVGQPSVQEIKAEPLLVTEKGPFVVGASAVIA
jgi:acetate---CoA ligase (ADP-forming)